MKILHCCLAAFYIDDFSYQENILPKIHKLQGHEVSILASTETYINNTSLGYVNPSTYKNRDQITVTRIPYVKWLPHHLARKIRIYSGITSYLNDNRPDVIFLHNFQFVSVKEFAKYAQNNHVTIFVDSHTDSINSGKSWISALILHKIVYRWCAKSIEKYVEKFYGTLPIRERYLEDMYGINKNKIDLLPFGVDDSIFEAEEKEGIRQATRGKLEVSKNDFLIITGGKIDNRKNIHQLMESFVKLQEKYSHSGVKLVVFGKPITSLKDRINSLSCHRDIIYLDWIDSNNIHKYLLASDLAFFPGTHSVLWESAVGLGVPCVFFKWEGITHVDVGGNCFFIESSDIEYLTNVLHNLIIDKRRYTKMKEVAQKYGPQNFSYSNIARKAIQDIH